MATYPNEEFQGIYDSILASMGDDATLKANLEAALRPMYDQSVEALRQKRIANNAAIDVDAASRGMGNSTWVTDAKLRQLRGESDQLASLNANYNNQLYSALLDAIKDRDDTAYNQAMQWWQYDQSKKGGSGSGGGTPEWLRKLLEEEDEKDISYKMPSNETLLMNPRPGTVRSMYNPDKKRREANTGVDIGKHSNTFVSKF
jgi:murein DD-endopeptidase MepM/ murein hydrolase activator NlpD